MILTFFYRNRQKDLNEKLDDLRKRIITIKALIHWKSLLLLKQSRLKKGEKGEEIVCKICKYFALNHLDAKLKDVKAKKIKVGNITNIFLKFFKCNNISDYTTVTIKYPFNYR